MAWARPGEAQNITHQQKKMGTTSLKAFRDRFKLPLRTRTGRKAALPDQFPAKARRNSKYMRERRMALGGYLPQRAAEGRAAAGAAAVRLRRPAEGGPARARVLHHHGLRAHARHLLRDKKLGKRVVPIVVDESRTFGMEGMFRQIGIWNQDGQNYTRRTPTS
jgi:pyruvate dehydrogenase E1 component